jgi:HEAT repeat protein
VKPGSIKFASIALLALTAGCEFPVSETKAIQLMSSSLPDGRREGMAALVTRFDDGKSPVFVARYRQLAEHDPDYTVRAMAIRALNICRDRSSTPLFIAGLGDQNESIRLESAKALANIPDRAAIPALVERLNGTHPVLDNGQYVSLTESRDVRIAAADALRHYKELEVEHALADALNAPEFGIAWQAHASLVTMTGQDLKYSEGAWLQLLTRAG